MLSTRLVMFSAFLSAFAAIAPTRVNALDQQLYGVNYDLRQGPDWDPKKCKTAGTIAKDLKTLSSITKNVRTYSLSGCDVASVLKEAKKQSLTVWLGVWVSADEEVFKKELSALKTLIADGLIDKNVVGMNVGSEAVYRGDITAEQSIKYLKEFKDVLKENNLEIPVAITDVGDILTQYPDMVAASDIVTANAFPFWEKIEASTAAEHFHKRIQPLLKLAGGKQVIITETGWPTAGNSPNASEASPEGAARYMNDFYMIAKDEGWKYYYFAGFDTPYKQEQSQNPTDVEGHFGIFTADGTLKKEYAALKFQKLAKTEATSSGSGSKENAKSSKASSSGTPASGNAAASGAGKDATTTGSANKPAAGSNTGADATVADGSKQQKTNDKSNKPAAGSSNASAHLVTAGLGACAALAASMIINL